MSTAAPQECVSLRTARELVVAAMALTNALLEYRGKLKTFCESLEDVAEFGESCSDERARLSSSCDAHGRGQGRSIEWRAKQDRG
jgi:hypothetical protein